MSSSSNSRGPGDLRSRRKEATRREILAAATDVFAEQGIQEARMETIAARACVSVGTLYNYFDDRNALVNSLLMTYHTEMLERLDAAAAQGVGKPFAERVHDFIGAIFEQMEAKRIFMAAILNDASRSEPADIDRERLNIGKNKANVMVELYKRADLICKQGVAEGALRPDDAEFYPSMLLGTLRGMLMHLIFRNDGGTELNADIATRFFLTGASKSRGH